MSKSLEDINEELIEAQKELISLLKQHVAYLQGVLDGEDS